MSRHDYKPNERIVDRAVALWLTMLSNPKYDNLGENSPEPPDSIRANTLSSILAASLPKNNTTDVLRRFGEELRKILLAPLEWEYDNGAGKPPSKYTTLFRDLHVDYNPDIPLRTAAERAGLDMQFPWNTGMYLYEHSLSVSYGYGSPYVYHYPLTNDRWLVTTLSGEDMPKLIKLVEDGVLDPQLNPIRCENESSMKTRPNTAAINEIMGRAPVGLSLRFTEAESELAHDTWGANCGPHSLAAILGKTLDEARALLAPKFDEKRYTNPTMMCNALALARQPIKVTKNLRTDQLCEGINRIQWEGPWLKPGVPPMVAYGYTHWVACREELVFCTAVPVVEFGWLAVDVWRNLVGVLCERENFAGWHVTHHYAW